MGLKAMSGKVVIKVLPPEEKNLGGVILLADESKEQIFGEVLAVCSDWDQLQPYPLNVGDKVIFAKGSGEDVTVDGVDVKVLGFKEVLIIL